jgi:hypothetical protein
MRDIAVNQFDKSTGLDSFSISNIYEATGINLLVAKVTKKILSSTFATTLFTYYGLDLQNIPQYGVGNNNIDSLNAVLSASLQNIVTSIQNNTSKNALNTEKLVSLSLSDLVYDNTTHQILIKLILNAASGDSQTLLFPLGA